MNGVLYIGISDNIEERVVEHQLKVYPKSFTAKYNCDRLVYLEEYDNGLEFLRRQESHDLRAKTSKIQILIRKVKRNN